MKKFDVKNVKLLIVIILELLVIAYFGRKILSPVTDITISSENIMEYNDDKNAINNFIYVENDNIVIDSKEEKVVRIGPDITILPGALYEISVECSGCVDDNGPILRLIKEDSSDYIFAVTQSYYHIVNGNAISRLYTSVNDNVEKASFVVQCYGHNRADIKAINIKECRTWVWVKLVGLIALFTFLNILVIFWSRFNKRRLCIVAALVAITVVVSLPAFSDFNYRGHDAEFHLARITSIAKELSYGNIPVRHYSDMLNGYGYSAPAYYGDLFLYLPAILYNLKLPLYTCYNVYIIFINLITTLIAFMCFKGISEDINLGLIGSFLYSFSAYRLCCIYTRFAVGEYTAMMFTPLVLLGMWKIFKQEKTSFANAFILAVGVAGIILSHSLSVEMMLIVLIILCIFNFKMVLCKHRVITLGIAIITCLLLTAWWLVPFIANYLQVGMLMNEDSHMLKIQNSGTYPSQILNPFYGMIGASHMNSTNDFGMSLGAGAIVGIALMVKYRYFTDSTTNCSLKKDKTIGAFWGTGIVVTYMTTIFFPWDFIGKIAGEAIDKFINTIQFSWRYLGFASAIFIVILIAVFVQLKKENPKVFQLITIIVCTITLVTFWSGMDYFIVNDETISYVSDEAPYDWIAGAEYLPAKVDYDQWKEEIAPEVTKGEIEIVNFYTNNGHMFIEVKNDECESEIICPIYKYANVDIIDKHNEAVESFTCSDVRLGIRIKGSYEGVIEIGFEEPVSWRLLEFISLITMCGVIAFFVRQKSRMRAN